MKTIKIVNTDSNEILNETEVTSEQLITESPLWQMQCHLYSLDGISARFEIHDPDYVPE